ncbi:OB-fold protein [Dyella amyloliquefaciens]|uniref:OB-fold protein n=1 Tax=Dyella amyloliquefaciens TaxID=1770545 RepID=UPI00197AF2A9|nr:hypothetical protein [Dyella amyloliquefaciens]
MVILVLLALGVVGAIVGDRDKPASTTETHSSPSPAPPEEPIPRQVTKVTANQLFNAYNANEVATDEGMKGTDVEVTGQVQEVAKDFTDSVVISLATSNEFMPARMSMEESERAQAATLKPGMTVAIVCPRMRRIMGSPAGSKCRFSDQAMTPPPAPSASVKAKKDQAAPQDVAALLAVEDDLDDKCRGSGVDFACAQRAFVRNKIMAKGWCWGPDDAPDEAHKRWLPCVAGQADLDPILSSVKAASFDCSKADRPDEIVICGNQDLSLMDGAIGRYYQQMKSLFPASSDKATELLDTQRQFLTVRRQCEADKACVEKVVARRFNALMGCSATYCDLQIEFRN